MRLTDVATTSAQVGASASRSAKITQLAALLSAAAVEADPSDRSRQVATVVSWLLGELPQRQIGVGWAALRSPPAPATAPTHTVSGVDAALTEIGRVAGKGSTARRAAWSPPCSARPPRTSSSFFVACCPASCGRARWAE